jgi:putative Mn2+ efflux pump MntP
VNSFAITILALALAVDAFSVAASSGPRCCPRWGAFRLGLSFGLFQAGMPLLGALVGAYLYTYVQQYDHWVAFGLLVSIGLKMLYDGLHHGQVHEVHPDTRFDPSCGWSLVGLSVATSIDAFGAGLGLRMVNANMWIACPLIGLVTALLSYLGARLGVTAEHLLGRRAEVLGGLVLIALGIKMLAM